jgi:hypothetical protein
MKKIILILIITVFIPSDLFAQDLRNTSISLDPLTLIGILLTVGSEDEESGEMDFNNMWFGMDINWETEKQKEAGFGIFLAGHRVSLKTQYRTYYNKERLCGVFWGLYGLIEWRRMSWYYDDDNELNINLSFPFAGGDNVYHSLGITGGADVGYRYRKNSFGVTPYIGLGIPLFFYLGSLPRKSYSKEFNLMNIALRAIHIGLNVDFFGNCPACSNPDSK